MCLVKNQIESLKYSLTNGSSCIKTHGDSLSSTIDHIEVPCIFMFRNLPTFKVLHGHGQWSTDFC